LKKLYVDATLPLRWGPHPPVGIPRVETALIRQALLTDTEIFMVPEEMMEEFDGVAGLLRY